MSDQNQSQDQASQQTSQQASQQTPDLADELRELGQQIEQTVRAALETERARAIRRDLSSGMQEIGKQVQAAIKSLQENPKIQEFTERGQKVVNQAQSTSAVKDFQETLASGVSQLNEKLAAFVTRMEHSQSSGSAASAQNVPVEDAADSATTGDTTRL